MFNIIIIGLVIFLIVRYIRKKKDSDNAAPTNIQPNNEYDGTITFEQNLLSEKDEQYISASYKDGIVYHKFQYGGYQPIGYYVLSTSHPVAEYIVYRDKECKQEIGYLQKERENIWLSREAIYQRFKAMEKSDGWIAAGMKAKMPIPLSKIVAETSYSNHGGSIFDKETFQIIATFRGDLVGASAAFIALSSELHSDSKYHRFLVDWEKC